MPKTKYEIFQILSDIANTFQIEILYKSEDVYLVEKEKLTPKKDQASDQASQNPEILLLEGYIRKKMKMVVPRLLERGHELGRRGLVLSREEIKNTIEKVSKEVWTLKNLKDLYLKEKSNEST